MSISTYNTFSEAGLTALTDHMKTTRNMAEANASAIGGLGEDLAGLSEEVVAALDNKQNTIEGTEGQTVEFDSTGKLVAANKPAAAIIRVW